MALPSQTTLLLMHESMPMDGIVFYVWEVQILNLLGNNRTKNDPSITKNIQHVHLLNMETKNI